MCSGQAPPKSKRAVEFVGEGVPIKVGGSLGYLVVGRGGRGKDGSGEGLPPPKLPDDHVTNMR